ncbi:DeoR/GlpR family DNA-binding transcription regulator [Pseudooceanicola algae]|uniref:Glycerol-3-phosphate regulon repressor n=1 Tax=Pseudooceanicola algae TaxID=1537215 RepID=A0A418SL06_9RHOB|nr:DeoR/GlpR family DNA-binding transcription regulator [Pseudooceanicola algae]QPM90895.1 Glycerol-3-phosphate regulon repressor [Pseudooceanicola algae]
MNRHLMILEEARSNGRVSVETLAEVFNLSTHTIRRDIKTLCEQGKLRRLHGGAEFVEDASNLPYSVRNSLNIAAKKQIATQAAQLIPDRATLFFSIGTTPALVATALTIRTGLTVITNNLNVAMILSEAPDVRIVLAGGELRLPDRDILGEQALALFEGYRADYAIFGVGGIDVDGSLLDFHEAEVRARQAMHRNARNSILVADVTKFGRRAAAVGGSLQDADHIVTDLRPDGSFGPQMDLLKDRLIVTGEQI